MFHFARGLRFISLPPSVSRFGDSIWEERITAARRRRIVLDALLDPRSACELPELRGLRGLHFGLGCNRGNRP